MAAQPPDPRTFKSWEDAFQYPIPTVRKLEQQLRKDIDENRQKLRSLVGASYRDLLGTAERIIEMDEQMHQVEDQLRHVGGQCNTRLLEKKEANYAGLRRAGREGEEAMMRTVVQTRVLQRALNVAARIVKRRADALVAAKLLVLARLLCKSISQSATAPAVLDSLRAKMGTLRTTLVEYIDRTLTSPSAMERQNKANVLCAYALLTSSSPREVLRHFLQLRYEQLDSTAVASMVDILDMLNSFHATIANTRDLFPRRLLDELSSLSKGPIVEDEQITTILELNLDIYASWFADDVRTFSLWVKHEQLTTRDVSDALTSWTRQALVCFLEAVKGSLEHQSDAQALLQARYDVLSKCLALNRDVNDDEYGQRIDEVRRAFLRRLQQLARDFEHVPKLALADTASSNNRGLSPDIWELAAEDISLANGATLFRKAVLDRYHGRSEWMNAQLDSVDRWTDQFERFWDVVQQMRSQRWENDDFDEEVEGLLQSFGQRDPETLRETLREAGTSAFRKLYQDVEQAAAQRWMAPDLLRLLRELDRRRRASADRLHAADDKMPNADTISALHLAVAEDVLETTIAETERHRGRKFYVPPSLWDGAPPLPARPSPQSFRLLVAISKAMSGLGNDIWSPAAVGVLKKVMADRLPSQYDQASQSVKQDVLVNGQADDTNQEPSNGDRSETHGIDATVSGELVVRKHAHDQLIQILYDMLYLQRVTHVANSESVDSALAKTAGEIQSQLHLSDTIVERMKKSASEHWKRTYLLFGLLASDV